MEETHKKLLPYNDPIKVYALAIDLTHIYYKCPFELDKIHLHGNDSRSLMNREEERCAHCEHGPRNITLVVNHFTRRCSMKLSRSGKRWRWDKASAKNLLKVHNKQKQKIWNQGSFARD